MRADAPGSRRSVAARRTGRFVTNEPVGRASGSVAAPARRLAAAAVPAILLAVALASGCTGTPAAPEPPASRVVLLGIDGADWTVIRPLAAQGRLPHFARLLEEGATGDLRSIAGFNSPALWTTVVTGKMPDEHGIPGWTVPGPDGDEELVTSTLREAPTVWEIAGDAGREATVVGWLASWPATPLAGRMVTSTTPYLGDRQSPEGRTEKPLKGSLVRDLPRQTFPPELIETVEPLLTPPLAPGDPQLARFLAPAGELSDRERRLARSLGVAHAADLTFRDVFHRLRDERRASLELLYLGGVDAVSHRFWRFMDPSRQDATEAEQRRFGAVVAEYYVFADEVLGELMEGLGPETTLIVCSDHGFRPARPGGHRAEEYSGAHRMQGIVGLFGAGVPEGRKIEGARLIDLAPTMLALLGLPPAEDMPGRVLAESAGLDPAAVAALGRVPSYGARAPETGGPTESASDEALLKQLRSLGYVQ